MTQENTQNEGEDQNNAESNSDLNTQETSVDRVAELERQLADKDRTIQEEVNRRQTLEARFSQPVVNPIPPKPEISDLEMAKGVANNLIDDPDKGAIELNNLIRNAVEKGKTEATAIISVNNEIDSIQSKNPHLEPLMPLIKQKASELMNAGFPLKNALKTASEEYQKIFNNMVGKSKTTTSKDSEKSESSTMKGAMSNNSAKIKTPPKQQQTVEEQYASRNANMRSKFSLNK